MKKSTLLLFALLSLITTNTSLGQGVVINEMQSSNTNTIADEDGDNSDWIELYNKSTTAVNLLGYGLSDDSAAPLKWVFPNVSIGPNQYLLVWASNKNRAVPGSPLHTSFKISASGNPISLANPSATIVDNIPPVALIPDISYGRLPNGTGNFVYFTNPTPNAVNPTVGYAELLNPPTFSSPSGFYAQGFPLTISSSNSGATIYYTLDGSEPNPERFGSWTTYNYKNIYPEKPGQSSGPLIPQTFSTLQYSSPITIADRSSLPNKIASISTTFSHDPTTYMPSNPIFKGTVVRAKVVKAGALSSPIVSKTYFITPLANNRFSLPVISLSVNENDFFDYNNGIYVAGVDFDNWRIANPTLDSYLIEGPGTANFSRDGKGTEKVANMTYFEKGVEQFNQDVGVQIHGLSSRDFPSKSLNIYPRSKYGNSKISHQIFSDRPFDDTFNSIVLRNAGNDFNQTMFKDALCHQLIESLNIITQRYQPTITFVNGEYWGILNLRDKVDGDYFNKEYNISKNELDYLENDGSYIQNGDNVNYSALQNYLNSNTLATQANYDYVVTQLDPDSFKDYFISNIFFENLDWPGNNIFYWRKKTAGYIPNAPYGHDGRWRWIAHDMDATFAINGDYNLNSLAAATDPNGPSSPNPAWSTLMLRRMLENNAFKIQFINRFADLLNTSFNTNRVISKINEMKAVIAPEMAGQYARWKMPLNDGDWNYWLSTETTFAQNRPDAQRTHIRQQFGISSNLTATLNVSDPTQGYIKMNTIDILSLTPGVLANPYPWTGIYFNNIPVTIKAVPLPGYAFSYWSGASSSTSNEITLIPTGNFSLTAHFAPAASVGASEIIYFWMMDTNIKDGAPLTSLNSTFGLSSTATLEYQSCLTGYPFTNTSSNWGKASMERRNSPTPLNYFQQFNGNLPFMSSNMRGIQIKQPFQNGALQNTMILNISTQNFKNIKLDFSVMDEGAATGVIVDYSSNVGTPVWTTAGMTTFSFPITGSYQVIEADFTNVTSANSNPNFKVRIRFTGPSMTTDSGKQVTFNNISVQGIPTTPLSTDEDSISNFVIYPNPVKSTLNISSNYDSVQYKIFSIDGKMINRGKLDSAELNVSNLPAGMYLLELNADGKTEVKKFIKN